MSRQLSLRKPPPLFIPKQRKETIRLSPVVQEKLYGLQQVKENCAHSREACIEKEIEEAIKR